MEKYNKTRQQLHSKRLALESDIAIIAFTHIIRDGSWKLVLCRYNSYMVSNNGEVKSQYVMGDFNVFGDMFKGILMGKAYEIDKLELLDINYKYLTFGVYYDK